MNNIIETGFFGNVGIFARVAFPHSKEENMLWRKAIKQIVNMAISDEIVSLVTETPQPYSIGKTDFEKQQLLSSVVANKDYLLNFEVEIDDEKSDLLSESEDFNRNLLFICKADKVEDIISLIKWHNSFSYSATSPEYSFNNEMLFLDEDGKILYWIYPNISKDKAKEELDQLITEIFK